jgi:hypothetical protein
VSKLSTHLTGAQLYNLTAKEDAAVSIELAKDSRTIALASKHDSSSMKTVAYMTMGFLPATFFAAFFAMPFFEWDTELATKRPFWIYWATTLSVTLLVFVVWYLLTKRKEIGERIENQRQRAEVLKKAKDGSMAANSRVETEDAVQTERVGMFDAPLVWLQALLKRYKRKKTT